MVETKVKSEQKKWSIAIGMIEKGDGKGSGQ